LRGEVIWTNQAAEMQRPEVTDMGMGIRFIFNNDEERFAFERDVEHLMVSSLGPQLFDRLIDNSKKVRKF